MNKLRITDLHCDTVTVAFDRGKSLFSNDLHISVDKLRSFEKFCQVFAVWSDDKISGEEAWIRFLKVADFFKKQLTADRIPAGSEVILAVEGGKLIGNELSRLDTVRKLGVRFFTLTWNDPCPICGACGTEDGVSDFGYEVLEKCRRIGIIPDISHASDKTAHDVIDFCERSGSICIATHSNSRAVCNHIRNLTDDLFKKLVKLGAVVGISMAPQHLNESGTADISDIADHIEHYLSLGGEDTVCLGCDFDGIDSTPRGIGSVSDVYRIADELVKRGYSEDLTDKIFYRNAHRFIDRYF